MQRAEEQSQIDDEGQDTVGADVRVFHDVEDALAVAAPTAKTVEEVGQPVFVQGTSEQHAGGNGQQHSQRIGQHLTAEIEHGGHHATREPAGQRPPLHHGIIALAGRLMQSPQGQTGEKHQGRPGTVEPLLTPYLGGLGAETEEIHV